MIVRFLPDLAERDGLVQCRTCDAWVDPSLGALPPGRTSDRAGTRTSPRAPGDYNDECDQCCYGRLR